MALPKGDAELCMTRDCQVAANRESDQRDLRGRAGLRGNWPGKSGECRQLRILRLQRPNVRAVDSQRRRIIARTQIEAYGAIDVFVEIAGMAMQQQETLGEEKNQQEAQSKHAL